MAKRRYKIKTIKVKCGDCNKFMVRSKDPLMMVREEHFINKCPKCKVEAQHFDGLSVITEEGKRPYLEIKWGLTLEQKAQINEDLKKQKLMREEYRKIEEDINKAMMEDYEKEKETP